MIIVLLNTKGGVGKTTTAASLAFELGELSPFLLDLVPLEAQIGCYAYRNHLPGVTLAKCLPGDVGRFIEQAGSRPVLIDCNPDMTISREAIHHADLVVVPGIAEFMPLKDSRKTLVGIQKQFPDKMVRFLLTMYVASRDKEKDGMNAAKAMFGGSMFYTHINRNVAVSDASRLGQTIMEYQPAALVSKQYKALAREIRAICDLDLGD